ncbi:MAG: alpha/beta hydrolase [Clostridia bacterium]|nr:alpha/beta hydrolase [Clostridia bacterium]
MRTEKIDLYEYFKVERPVGAAGYLTTLLLDEYNFVEGRLRPAMLVIAGGGYSIVSQREKEPVAMKYLANGFNCFILDYSVSPVSFPYQLVEGAMAMAYIRKNAKKLGVDNDHVSAVGFSAGGHLCGMLATLFNAPELYDTLGKDAEYCRPDAVILSYPVITSGEKAHKGSIENLSGRDESLYERLSLEKQVTKNSPPAFIWTTTTDACVPMENSIYMAMAYRENGVPFELHVFESGQHGLSVAELETNIENVPVQQWIPLSITWLKNRGFKIKK